MASKSREQNQRKGKNLGQGVAGITDQERRNSRTVAKRHPPKINPIGSPQANKASRGTARTTTLGTKNGAARIMARAGGYGRNRAGAHLSATASS